MSARRLSVSFLFGWLSIVLIAFTSRISIAGGALSGSEYLGWVFLTLAPVAMTLLMARARSTGSIAQVLYDVEHASPAADEARARLTRD